MYGRAIWISCDFKGCEHEDFVLTGAVTRTELRRRAREAGWVVEQTGWANCPPHREQEKERARRALFGEPTTQEEKA